MNPLACLALSSALVPPPAGSEAPAPQCVQLGAEVAGRLTESWPQEGLHRGVSLSRGRAELGLAQATTSARVAVAAVRSGGEASYIGVAGESVVPRVQVAEARLHAPRLGLVAAAGMVDDPWVVTGNHSWDLRAVAAGVGEDQGWLDRSDLGGLVGWTSPGSWATTTVVLSSGEGLARRERNTGLDTAGLLILRPLAGTGAPERLALHAFGRDGSRGLGRARDHRLGLRLATRGDWGAGAVELLQAWGVDGDATRRPRAWSAWGQLGPPDLPVVAWGRIDHVDEDPAVHPTNRQSLHAGLGWSLPPGRTTGAAPASAPGRLSLGLRHDRQDPLVASIAGAEALTRRTALFLQLDLRLRATLSDVQPAGFP